MNGIDTNNPKELQYSFTKILTFNAKFLFGVLKQQKAELLTNLKRYFLTLGFKLVALGDGLIGIAA